MNNQAPETTTQRNIWGRGFGRLVVQGFLFLAHGKLSPAMVVAAKSN